MASYMGMGRARIFDGIDIIDDGILIVEDGKVMHVGDGKEIPKVFRRLDPYIDLIMPGIVDLHSDTLEKCIEMRPGVYFDPDFALSSLDIRLASCGITTFCHAVSLADNEFGLREPEEAVRIIQRIKEFNNRPDTLVNHLVHARYEISSQKSYEAIRNLMQEHLIDLFSIMDHTPGQGQFKTIQSFINYYTRTYNFSREETHEIIDRKEKNRMQGWERIKELCHIASELNIPILSHDDDTVDKIDLIKGIGVKACEFPVSLDAAEYATLQKIKIFMGAPNLLRNCSSNGNLKTSETLKRGLLTGLISDYYPETLLQAPFVATSRDSLPLKESLALITGNPGKFLNGKITKGMLKTGADADFALIRTGPGWWRIMETWCRGRCVFRTSL